MAKEYDFQKAKRIIEENKNRLKMASLGMQEDWFWTAEDVFSESEYTLDLESAEMIAGIPGSEWATPVIELEYLDGSREVFECFIGESERFRPFGITDGPLSGPVQDIRPKVKQYERGIR